MIDMNRREFLKSGSAAMAAAGVAGCVTADITASVEKTIAETKFIDVHAHCTYDPMPGTYSADMKPLCTADDLVGFYDRFGVEKGVVLALCNPENFVGGMSTEEILRTCSLAPDRLLPSVGLDPRGLGNSMLSNYFGDALKYYRDKGCRICGEVCANLHFLDPRMQNLFRGCEEAGLPLTFHIAADQDWLYGIIDERGLPELEICLQRFPKLKFFGHSQSFWCEIGTYGTWDERTGFPQGQVREGRIPELMRKYPNLYGDLSAGSGNNSLMRDPEYAGKFLTEFQDRLLFALDICAPKGFISPLPDTLKELLRTGRITETVYRKVARENAVRILGLS